MSDGLRAGVVEPHELRNYGFMIQRTIEDFEGRTWEIFYMDMSKTEDKIGNPIIDCKNNKQ